MLAHVPVPHAKFSDGIYALGKPTKEDRTKQSTLSAASFLFRVLKGEASPVCPLRDGKACLESRTLECSQFPWARGDLGKGQYCEQGALGHVLMIESAQLNKYVRTSDTIKR